MADAFHGNSNPGLLKVGRDLVDQVGHPAVPLVRKLALVLLWHPRLDAIKRRKFEIAVFLASLPVLAAWLKKLDNDRKNKVIDFSGKYVQIWGGEDQDIDIGVTTITQDGRTVTVLNHTQDWKCQIGKVIEGAFIIEHPPQLAGRGWGFMEGGREKLGCNANLVWRRATIEEIDEFDEKQAEITGVQAKTAQSSDFSEADAAPAQDIDTVAMQVELTKSKVSTWSMLQGMEQGGDPMGIRELVVNIILTLASGSVMVTKANLLGGLVQHMYTAGPGGLVSKEWIRIAAQYPLWCLFNVACGEGAGYMQSRIALKWRRNLTHRLHAAYFSKMRYYRILTDSSGKTIQDPDMRICKEIKEMVGVLSQLGLAFVMSGIYLVQFGSVTIQQRHWTWSLCPPLFFGAALMSIVRAEPTERYYCWEQLAELEGKTTQVFTRLQLCAERICMLQGEKYERDLVDVDSKKITELHVRSEDLGIRREFVQDVCYNSPFGAALIELLGFFTAACMAANTVGEQVGAIMDPSEATTWTPHFFSEYLRDLHGFFNSTSGWGILFSSYTSWINFEYIVDRVKQLYVHLINLEAQQADNSFFTDRGPVIDFSDVTVQTPTGQVLVRGLNVTVKEGDALLICGHNGAGKSSIIRALCNLWPVPKGQIARPGGCQQAEEESTLHDELYYLPQKPCNVLGSLSDQLTYPVIIPGGLPDKELRLWLSYAGVEYLIDRNLTGSISRVYNAGEKDKADIDWEVLLSIGEQQALSIARLFYHHPRFAILDECTSAVGKDLERRLFEVAKEIGMSCITITHRPALKEHHERMLTLTGLQLDDKDGRGWELSKLAHESSPYVTSKSRCKDVADVHERIQNVMKKTQAFGTQLSLSSEENAKEENDVSKLSPAQAVRARWPSGRARIWAMCRMALHTKEMRSIALTRFMKMAVTLLVRPTAYWGYARCVMGMMRSGLNGDLPSVLANSFVALAFCGICTTFDVNFKVQANKLQIEMGRKMVERMQEKVLEDGMLAKLTCKAGVGTMEAVENPILRLNEFRAPYKAMADQLKDFAIPVVQMITVLPMMWQGLRWLTPTLIITNFFCFRGFQLLAPDFGAMSARDSALESRLQFLHTRLRSIAEPVAFSGGGGAERQLIEPRLEAVLDNCDLTARKKLVYNTMMNLFTDYRQIPLWTQRLASMQYVMTNSPSMNGNVSPDQIAANMLFDRTIQYTQVGTQKLVRLAEAVSNIDGQCIRCLELALACELASASSATASAASAADGKDPAAEENSVAAGEQRICVQGLDLITPRGISLAKGVCFEAEPGEPLVITGPNACGKSLLGSVLLGLWPAAGDAPSISILGRKSARPPLSALMPAPQQIYLPLGNLISQVTYPTTSWGAYNQESDVFECTVKGMPEGTSMEELYDLFKYVGANAARIESESPWMGILSFSSRDILYYAMRETVTSKDGVELETDLPFPSGEPRPANLPCLSLAKRCLRAVGIEHILKRELSGWLSEHMWEDCLSGGEKQRLCMARVLYHKPVFALLDECTSMVSVDVEEELYRRIFRDWGITPITLTQRSFMTDFYTRELSLGANNDSGWEWKKKVLESRSGNETQKVGAEGRTKNADLKQKA